MRVRIGIASSNETAEITFVQTYDKTLTLQWFTKYKLVQFVDATCETCTTIPQTLRISVECRKSWIFFWIFRFTQTEFTLWISLWSDSSFWIPFFSARMKKFNNCFLWFSGFVYLHEISRLPISQRQRGRNANACFFIRLMSFLFQKGETKKCVFLIENWNRPNWDGKLLNCLRWELSTVMIHIRFEKRAALEIKCLEHWMHLE